MGFRYPELYGAWAHVKASVRALRERRVLHNQHNVIAILRLLLLLCLNRMARTLKSTGGNEIRLRLPPLQRIQKRTCEVGLYV